MDPVTVSICTAIYASVVSLGIALYNKRQTDEAKLKAANAEALAEGAAARDRERLERERMEGSEKKTANRTRTWMFAHEAVELHRRWVLYAAQAYEIVSAKGTGGRISASRPFEWVQGSTVEEYLRAGGDREVVQAVYRVKQLNAQVTRQLDDVHKGRADGVGRILGFVFAPDEWEAVCNAIRTLLRHAEAAGNEVSDLSRSFDAKLVERRRRA